MSNILTSSFNTNNLIPLESVLQDIYRIVAKRGNVFSEDDLEESAAAAASHLFNYKFIETAVCIKCINNHKVVMPDYYDIKTVLYKTCFEDKDSTCTIQTTDVKIAEDGTGKLSYKDAYKALKSYTSNGWVTMQLAHSIAGMVEICNTNTGVGERCNLTYSVKGNLMSTYPETGYVVIVYDRILRDDETNQLLIPNVQIVNEAIRAYVMWEMYAYEDNMHRQGSESRESKWFRRWQSLSAECAGELMMPSLPEYVSMVSETNRHMKISDHPDRLYDSHYGPEDIYFGNDSEYKNNYYNYY